MVIPFPYGWPFGNYITRPWRIRRPAGSYQPELRRPIPSGDTPPRAFARGRGQRAIRGGRPATYRVIVILSRKLAGLWTEQGRQAPGHARFGLISTVMGWGCREPERRADAGDVFLLGAGRVERLVAVDDVELVVWSFSSLGSSSASLVVHAACLFVQVVCVARGVDSCWATRRCGHSPSRRGCALHARHLYWSPCSSVFRCRASWLREPSQRAAGLCCSCAG